MPRLGTRDHRLWTTRVARILALRDLKASLLIKVSAHLGDNLFENDQSFLQMSQLGGGVVDHFRIAPSAPFFVLALCGAFGLVVQGRNGRLSEFCTFQLQIDVGHELLMLWRGRILEATHDVLNPSLIILPDIDELLVAVLLSEEDKEVVHLADAKLAQLASPSISRVAGSHGRETIAQAHGGLSM